MAVAEYCGNCDKRTLRKVGPCPECTPKNVESQTTDTQQLKAEIAALASIIQRDQKLLFDTDVRFIYDKMRQLSAV